MPEISEPKKNEFSGDTFIDNLEQQRYYLGQIQKLDKERRRLQMQVQLLTEQRDKLQSSIDRMRQPPLITAQLITSLEELVLMDEIIGMARRIGRGIEVNEETLVKDLIIKNGPGKSYFELDHTLKNFRKELWFPTIKDNKPYEVWEADGKLTMRDRAKNKIDEILASENPKELSGRIKSELKDVLASL